MPTGRQDGNKFKITSCPLDVIDSLRHLRRKVDRRDPRTHESTAYAVTVAGLESFNDHR